MNALPELPSIRKTGAIALSIAALVILMAAVIPRAATSRRTGDPEPQTMIVSDMSLTVVQDRRIRATIFIRSNGDAVHNASIQAQLTLPTGQSVWLRGRTSRNGRYVQDFPLRGPGAYSLSVVNVTAKNKDFDPRASIRLETTITVGSQPVEPTPTSTLPNVAPTATSPAAPAPPTATATETSLPAASPTATSTPIPAPTNTPAPTATTVPPSPTATTPPPPPSPTATSATTSDSPGQPCSDAVHNRFVAPGPDGNLYPTWHPPVDPLTGCVFDHEHGDNPNGNPAMRGRNVVFCYLASVTGNCMPHEGYKVFAWANISHPNAPAHTGASVVMVLHQGTSAAGRFTNPFHDIEIHYYHPSDGREAHIYLLAPFGDLLVGCGANDPAMELRVRQANAPGARQVAADRCFDSPNIPYEDWITALYIGTDNQGNWKAYMDPHFAIFNPNTYCIVQGASCQLGYSDVRAGTGADPNSTDSWFKGDKREGYLNQVWLNNAGGSTTIWTDAYGKLVPAGQGIPQYIAAVNRQPLTNSAAFGADNDHDPAGAVHAPN